MSIRRTARMLLVIVAAIVVLFVIARLTVLPQIFAAPTETVDFATLERPSTANAFLVCPPGLCAATADLESPAFPVPVARLREAWDRAVATRPRMVVTSTGAEGADYVDRSLVFGFPDLVSVRFVPLGEAESTLAIYSRSVYGRGDMGVNEARVRDLLAALDRELPR